MGLTKTDRQLGRLLAAMTLEEKIGQLTMLTAEWAVTGPKLSEDYLGAVRAGRAGNLLNLWGAERTREAQRIALEETRLGIPLLLGFDVVHGHHTIFPVPLGEAAAFDPVLWEETARAAADEAAADGVALTFAPMLDVARDPRWGRIVEGPGEDVYVASRMAEAKTHGFQGTDLADPRRVAATAKHLAAYGAAVAGRDYASADISGRDFQEVYLPPFQVAIEAGTAAIMPGFHDLAGVPMTANAAVLDDLVRTRWGFNGAMISDYNAIAELIEHGVAADIVEAAALALKAGVDIDMMADAYHRGLPAALERGLVTMADIDRSVRRVLALKARLGLFEDPYRRGATPLSAERSAEIRTLARRAAHQSMVLLSNRDSILPLRPGIARLALIGPLADNKPDMLGSWAGAGKRESPVSFRDGLQKALPNTTIRYEPGTGISEGDEAGITAACEAAKGAELVILCIGESATMSGEASSRARPIVPPIQEHLAERLLDLGKPVVVVLSSGRPLMIETLASRAHAVLATWQLGTEAGTALADVLTGAAEPSGRLPVSWPIDVGQIPIYFGHRHTGRPPDPVQHYTSKYLDLPVTPLFPFGHGLGYGKFAWRDLMVEPAVFGPNDTLRISVTVANEGDRAGEALTLLFSHDKVASIAPVELELKGFHRVTLAAGQSEPVRFEIAAKDLAFAGAAPGFLPVLEPGSFEILVGPSADRGHLVVSEVQLKGGVPAAGRSVKNSSAHL